MADPRRAAGPGGGPAGGRFSPRLSLLPLRSRGYRLLFAGQAVSEFGNAFHLVALPLLVHSFGGTAGELGTVVGAYGVGRLAATPLGGTLADRWGAWRIMMLSDLGRAVATLLLAGVAVAGPGSLLPVGALAGAVGVGAGLFQPAAWAVTPSLLPPEQLQAGNSLSSTGNFAAGLVGPAVAGVLVAFLGPGVALAVDAATFVVSAAALLMIGRGRPVAAPADAGDKAAPPRTVLGLLRESPLLRTVLAVTLAANLTMGGTTRVALPSLATDGLAAGAVGLGALLAAFTGGALAGALLCAGLAGADSRGRTAMLSGLVMGVALGLVPFGGVLGAVLALFVAGGASTVTNVLVVTGVQKSTPPRFLARVMAAVTFCGLGVFPLSVVLAGAVVDAFGSRTAFVATGGCLLAAFGWALTRREIRGL